MSTKYLGATTICVLCIMLLACDQSMNSEDEPTKPNILFIMSDDHTTQAFGVYGSRLAGLDPTPNIDRLAKEGMLFENTFCTNSICTPSRATIMTGQYGLTNGVIDLDGNLPADRQFLAHEMKNLGYQTAMVGKWHLKHAPDAFDYYNVLPGQGKYFDPVLYSNEDGTPREMRFSSEITRSVKATDYEGHSSDVITDISLEWLQNRRDPDKPFFLMHHFKAPHDFFEFAPRYADYLEDVEIPEPTNMYDQPAEGFGSVATRGENDGLIREIGSSIGHRNIIRNMGMHMDIDSEIPDPEYTHLAYQEYLKRYLRCVKGVDDNVKRLFDYLEEEDLKDNTIIIYTGDQGFMLGEHDYIDKRWMYEESMRMPLLVRFPPSVQAGSRSDAMINNTDFAPTMIDMAGGQVPEYMQGHSFKSILESGEEPENWRQSTYYRYWMHMAHRHANPAHFGIRNKNYKLILFYGMYYKPSRTVDNIEGTGNRYGFQTPIAWEFYDLTQDPLEMDNRYDDPAYTAIIKEMKEDLELLREDLNETDENYPEIQDLVQANWE